MPIDPSSALFKINKHAHYIANPEIRQRLFQQFTPNFYFHKDEINFPGHPDTIIKNIIQEKYKLYKEMQKENKTLTPKESEELLAMETYFFNKDGIFNDNYYLHQNKLDVIKLTEKINDADPHPEFLILDEKHYGRKVGTMVDVQGILPIGHPRKGNNIERPPCCAAICPTVTGFCIDYEFIYPLNHAITGLRWLRNILPESWCKKLSNLGFHYGDCEGVSVYVNINDEGECEFEGMRTWAHGRDYSRHVKASQCTYDAEGHPCVYVGLGGHPSYADNFIGRNSALDLVGDAYNILPNHFIDTSQDVLSAALALTDEQSEAAQAFPKSIQAVARELPHSLTTFRRIADSNPATFSRGTSPDRVLSDDTDKKANQYKPFLFFTKLWQQLKAFFFKQPEHGVLTLYRFDQVISDDFLASKPMIPSSCQNILSAVLAENETKVEAIQAYVPKSAHDLNCLQSKSATSESYHGIMSGIGNNESATTKDEATPQPIANNSKIADVPFRPTEGAPKP